jgi:hypothetical protein
MDPSTLTTGGMGGILAVIIQGGSFALLCFIVYWLTQWVPKRVERNDVLREAEAKSRETVSENLRKAVELQTQTEAANREKVAETLRKAVEAQAAAMVAATDKLNQAHAEQLRYERESCDKRFNELIDRIDHNLQHMMKHYELTREIRHEVANIAQSRANEKVVREHEQIQSRVSRLPGHTTTNPPSSSSQT